MWTMKQLGRLLLASLPAWECCSECSHYTVCSVPGPRHNVCHGMNDEPQSHRGAACSPLTCATAVTTVHSQPLIECSLYTSWLPAYNCTWLVVNKPLTSSSIMFDVYQWKYLSLLYLQKNVDILYAHFITTKYKGQTQIRICTYIRNWLNLNMKRNQSNIHKNMRVEFDPLQWILSSCVRAVFPVAGNPLLQRMFFWLYFNSCLGCVLLSSPADGWIRLHSHPWTIAVICTRSRLCFLVPQWGWKCWQGSRHVSDVWQYLEVGP